MMTQKLIPCRGIPTVTDVKLLLATFDDLAPGDKIKYDRISEVLTLGRDENRWKTVVSAWRKRLYQESNLLLFANPGVGFEVMDNHDRVAYSGQQHKQGLRKIGKSADCALRTEKKGLTNEEVKTVEHFKKIGATITVLAATEAKRLNFPVID